MDAEAIAAALGGRRTGENSWLVQCPVHEDRTPSLSVKDGYDGRVLLHCFAGCSFRDIAKALRDIGLWQDEKRPVTAEQRRRRKLQRKRSEAKRIVDKFESMPLSVRQDIEPEAFDAEWLRYERARALLAMEEA